MSRDDRSLFPINPLAEEPALPLRTVFLRVFLVFFFLALVFSLSK